MQAGPAVRILGHYNCCSTHWPRGGGGSDSTRVYWGIDAPRPVLRDCVRFGGRDGLGGAPITVGPHALVHHNDPSGEAGKRDQAQNEGQFRKIPRRSKVNKKNDMSSAAQNEGRPFWVGWRLRWYSARGAIKSADEP